MTSPDVARIEATLKGIEKAMDKGFAAAEKSADAITEQLKDFTDDCAVHRGQFLNRFMNIERSEIAMKVKLGMVFTIFGLAIGALVTHFIKGG